MMTTPFDHGALLAVLEPLAIRAGEEILAVRANGIVASQKADQSPVTEADNRAEAVILTGLRHTYPDIAIVAEEEASAGRLPDISAASFFLVDPLDGTREFINGNADFTVNIALIEHGVPVLGMVYAPARGVLYGGSAAGAFRAEVLAGSRVVGRKPIKGSPPADHIRIVASRSHNTPETDAFVARFQGAERVSVGSSLKFCLLAEGAADVYPRFGRTMEWDTAAGDAVLRAAGGRTQTMDGEALLYGKRNQINDVDFSNPHFISVTSQASRLV